MAVDSFIGSIDSNKPLNYEITYVTEYGSVASTNGSTLTASELPTLTQEGYDFCGWYYEDTYETQAQVGDTLEEAVTLYAKWTKSAVVELTPFLTNIANAIRAKKGTTDKINAQDFASEIESIEGGASSSAILDDGWTGTPVSLDASVVVENIYINTNLSVDEVVSILDNALSHYSTDGAGQFGVFIHQGDTGNFGPMLFGIVAEGIYAILAGIDNDNQTMLFAYDTTGQGQDVAQIGFSGWNQDFNGIFEVNATNNISSMTNQEVNNQLSNLVSITPFERVNITLNGVYQTNRLVIDHYGQYDLLESFVDDKVFIKTVDVNPQLDNATYSGEIDIYNPTVEYQDQGGIVNFYGIKENFVISTLYSSDEAYSLIFMTIATNTEGMAWKLNNVEYSIGQTEQTDNGWFTTLKIKPLGESWTFHWLD